MCAPDPELSDLESFSTEPMPKGQGQCVSSTSPTPEWAPCDNSYFLSGGIIAVAPQPVSQGDSFQEATVVVVPNTWGYHVEFGGIRDLQSLRHAEGGICAMLGDDGGAVFWCMQKGGPSEFLAGMFLALSFVLMLTDSITGGVYCPMELQASSSCTQNTSWTDTLELATSVYIFRQSATVYYHRSNLSIFQIADLSPPVETNFSLIDFSAGLIDLTNNSICPLSLAHYTDTMLAGTDNENAAILVVKHTRTIFALVLYYFNANMVGANDSIWTLQGPRQGLPEDMYTIASISRPAWQVVASRRSLWVFVALEAALLLVCLVAMVMSHQNISRWPTRTG
jgi:hypothetical protein